MTTDSSETSHFPREESQEALRDRLRAVMEACQDIVVSLDNSGNILTANSQLHTELGFSLDEVSDKPIDILLADPADSEEYASLEHIRDTLLGIRKTSVLVPFLDAKGNVHPMRLHGEPVFGADDTIIGVMMVASPSDHRSPEFDVIKRQRDEFAIFNQVLRHDIRNDANLILELTRRLQQQEFDEQTESMLAQLEDGAHRIVDLTERARELIAALEALDNDRVPIALTPILTEEVAKASTVTPDTTVRLEQDPPELTVLANDMLGAVFRNLLSNAIHHNGADDAEVTVSVDQLDDVVEITVADNGPGVPDTIETAVENGNIALDDATKAGFGLYIVLTLLERFHGDLSIAPNHPRGTKFQVTLERAKEE